MSVRKKFPAHLEFFQKFRATQLIETFEDF